MQTALLVLAGVSVLVHLITNLDALLGGRRIRRLADAPVDDAPLPSVSVVIAARNEERNLESALRSVLGQDHGDLEVIVVDDRSTDRTSEILARLAAEHERLTVVRVEQLPEGWLGKNHALQRGAERARGELLLFTDADVVMEPETVRLAVSHLVREGLDHLTLGPRIEIPTRALEALIGGFSVFFCLWARPWKARDPGSHRYVGIGAFNLVRVGAWRAAGTHAAIRMRIDDDMMLGKILKREGRTQELLIGGRMIRVEWYPSAPALVRGLSKNAYAGFEFRTWAVVLATLLQLALYVWPWLALVLTDGWVRLLDALCVGLMGIYFLGSNLESGVRPRFFLAFPLVVLVLVYAQWRSMLKALWHGHVEWRGTRYLLRELRSARV